MQALIDRLPQLAQGFSLNIMLAFLSLFFALFMGLMGAWGKLSNGLIAPFLARAYTTLIRGIPEIVLLLLLFYGLQIVINNITDALGLPVININAFVWGVLVIGFIYGAYMTETFRGAFMSVPKGQIEAAKACGMSRVLMFRRVVWPQMMRYALPGLGNNWLVLIKATALISLIGLKDLVWWSNSAGKAEGQPFTFMLVVLAAYLMINEGSLRCLKYLEKKYSAGTVRFND